MLQRWAGVISMLFLRSATLFRPVSTDTLFSADSAERSNSVHSAHPEEAAACTGVSVYFTKTTKGDKYEQKNG